MANEADVRRVDGKSGRGGAQEDYRWETEHPCNTGEQEVESHIKTHTHKGKLQNKTVKITS